MQSRTHSGPASLIIALVVLATLVGASTTALAASFTNGSFEVGTNPPALFRSILTGDPSITGWAISGRIDWTNGGPSGVPGWSFDGSYGVQIVADSGASSISQMFDTMGGTLYDVSFFVTPTPGIQTSPLFVDFTNNGATQTFMVEFPSIGSTYAYVEHDFEFSTAPGTLFSVLSFRNDSTHVGPFIDAVTVSPHVGAVPEPSAFVLVVLGVPAIALVARSCRRGPRRSGVRE